MGNHHTKPVDEHFIPVIKPLVGQLYHVSWGYSRGIVGRCSGVDEKEKTVILVTPKTKKQFQKPVRWEDLRHTRKNQLKNPH